MTLAPRLAALALCSLAWLPVSAVLAQEAAAPAPVASEEEAGIAWPSPWEQAGTRLVYDVKSVAERHRNTGDTVVTIRSVQTIRPDATASGMAQVWTESDISFEFHDGIPTEQQALMRAMARAFEGKEAVVQLNEEGNAVGLANAAELLPAYRAALRQFADQAIEAGLAHQATTIPDAAKRAEAEQALRAGMARTLETMGSESVLVSSALKVPGAYDFPGRGGIVPGEAYAYEEQSPNPFGGEAFPMLGEFELKVPAADATEYEITWTLRLHPTRSPPILWALVEKLTGQPLAPEVRQGMPDTIDFSYLTHYRIDRRSGAVTWMERTETRKVMEVHDRTVTTMTLRAGG